MTIAVDLGRKATKTNKLLLYAHGNMIYQIHLGLLLFAHGNIISDHTKADLTSYFFVLVTKLQFIIVLFVCFVALHPKSTAMVIAGWSVHLTTLFPGQA